jgi:nicotinamide riboside kinase
VAIDGAQSTGKTTVFNHLHQNISGRVTFIPEASRILAEQFGVLGASDWPHLLADQRRLLEFFDAEEAWQISAELRSKAFVVDSSLYLIRAYREYFKALPSDGERVEPRYDLILYCPVVQLGAEDGFRFLQGRTEIDRLCRDILHRCHGGQLIELPPDESRFRQAEEAVLGCFERRHQEGTVDNGTL